MDAASFSKTPFTLILFDINNFKQLNDYYGYNAGNVCLAHIAKQIKRFLSPQDLICRTEGDEFLILTDGKHTLESKVVKNLIHNIDNVWKYENHLLLLKYRMGISIFPDHGKTVSELMKSADESLVEAKKTNAPQVVIYNEQLAERKRATEIITAQLKKTLSGKSSSNRFVLHYQPKVDRHGTVKSAECLVRWIYEDKLYYPGTFIEIAEKTGLIYEIGDIVLDTGCKELALIAQQNPTVNIALNISPQQLNNTKLFNSIHDKITKYSVNPEQLELEITESTIMDSWNSSEVETFIKQVRTAGIKVSIDDFGTGLSSLSRLLEMPADILKIDRSFVIHLPDNKKSQHMCKSITSLAHDLGMSVVAEGVEQTGQAVFLYSINCDYIQGFCFYKPMPFDDFITLLANQ
ncbi:MAG TPA: bifunctional diguanylate cyclase/phosphodiesterase [Spirochaetia bacterium]|nr:bifunctional diguanylate cyclase/phosphodiesterase [Spirochaetales bacterium]HRS64424.1 bifunctional diguanylate cyclase/phosphodiesterase [Spirochaetia bacterium]HOT58578.1 bifunctional diguanylate cyclase/phosphodiesterase [Spirochaetales bacterium]HPD79963.1 bifunctional diguanylate cyclase/phosphodiesterase [Spirochaetales bacterium]HQG40295.1 bifunctional diguanylate cyclase/phosphodiesterase [Spirochaetales bacterium]